MEPLLERRRRLEALNTVDSRHRSRDEGEHIETAERLGPTFDQLAAELLLGDITHERRDRHASIDGKAHDLRAALRFLR